MFKLIGYRHLICLLFIPALVHGQNARLDNPSQQRVTPVQAYTVEFKTENVQTLANGTTITTESKEVRARDSQGRSLFITTRTPLVPGSEVTSGSIDNPADNTKIMWNSREKKASVLQLPAQDRRHGCWTSDSHHLTINYGGDVPRANLMLGGGGGAGVGTTSAEGEEIPKIEHTVEKLGTATIQGLEATGTRYISVTPVGRVGNDNPITTTREVWRSTEFPFPLREVYDDPRGGKRTREVVSLAIGEPENSIFQPPEGYEVVNEEMHQVTCQQ